MEIWKPIEGFETSYLISNLGNIKSLERTVSFGKNKRIVKNKLRKVQHHTTGYLFIILSKGNQFLIHRLVGFAFIPNPENKPFINHKDGNKKNNSIDNLQWCTRKENEAHAFATGLKNSTGSNNNMAKLNEDDVMEIRLMHANGINIKQISNQFNVTMTNVNRICAYKIWKHVII